MNNKIIEKEMLEKVKEAEKNTKINQDPYKLGYHLMPPTGWLNDPNGLCQFKGVYHVFFQYSPFDAEGGDKFWGHYVSKDMISWEYKGPVMGPDTPYDKDGVYSGSTFVENGKMYMYYTGNVKESGNHDYITSGRGANVLLVTSEDGENFSEKELLMTNEDYPSNYTCHIRDPKVWKEDTTYYMVLGGREKVDGTEFSDIGKVLVYSSVDLKNWKLENEIESKERFGYMWECPDMIDLNGNKFLSISPQGLESEDFKYQNVYQSGYYPLKGDFRNQYFLGDFVEWDMGFDFYAPQSFVDEKGRVILIGWMGLPDIDYTNKTLEYGWQHNLTLPRELSIKDGIILQNPVAELKEIRKSEEEIELNKEISLDGLYELELNSIGQSIDKLKMIISKGLEVSYDKETSILKMEFKNDIGSGRNIRKAKLESLDKIHMFVDKSSIEIFINNGKMVFTTRFYPDEYTLEIIVDKNIESKLWNLAPEEMKF